ncbi:tol-pal system protein YbgF [Aliidiomarina iranensis]|uniref:Cell division coordinator CpoB n=1 Tax=Aliidiomarina iranensis TaxID=1434071 RepID=A0A432VTH0_9GAMM|nr:tol-pal system protein YbgF [Aliidiomarina iranensis]RUO19680.1 tol-pal system protein YbgF [Aliidiomarina iranensis]
MKVSSFVITLGFVSLASAAVSSGTVSLSPASVANILFGSAAHAQGAPVVSAANAQQSNETAIQRNETVPQRLDRLERMLAGRSQGQAEMLEQIGRLQRELSELRGVTEEHTYQLEQMLQRQRDIYQELDRLSQQLRQSNETAAPVLPTSGVSFSENESENVAYDRAVALVLQERQYERAIPQFQAFLENYPGSSYTSNAHYWLGQLFYAQESYSEAKVHFSTVVRDFPDSNKRADCLLKLGMIAATENNRSEAQRFFNQVRSEYSNSTEAEMAGRQLENL